MRTVAYRLNVADLDARMWTFKFVEFTRCPKCGFRTDFFASNSSFKVRRRTPDICTTYDREKIVTTRFRHYCESHSLNGLTYLPLNSDFEHFHIQCDRQISIDLERSNFEVSKRCSLCGNYEHIVTKGNPTWLSETPADPGFYRTDLLLGGEDLKAPQLIVNEYTKTLLEQSGLKGFRSFEPVFGDVAPRPIAIPEIVPPTDSRQIENRLDLAALKELVQDPAPGFKCRNRNFPRRRLVVPVERRLFGPPNENDLVRIEQLLEGTSSQLLELYKRHNGFELYAQAETDNIGVRLAPVAEWENLTRASKESLPADVSAPKYIAVGEVPGSGNYFVILLEGQDAGKIALSDHELASVEVFAEDVNEFLEIVCKDPVDLLLNTLGSYIRYSSPESRDWIPEKYFSDIRKLKKRKS